jgi:hypothetical protein
MADHLSLAEKSSENPTIRQSVVVRVVPWDSQWYPGTLIHQLRSKPKMTSLSPPRKYAPDLTQHSVCVIMTYRNLMAWVLCMRQRHPKRPPTSWQIRKPSLHCESFVAGLAATPAGHQEGQP